MNNNDIVPPGIVCTPVQYERSLTDNSIHCLTRPESIGLTVVTHAGFISLFAVLYVFTIILRNITWRIRHVSRELHVFDGPMDMLMFSLFLAVVLQAIGTVMNIRWIHDGRVEVGAFCNAQGIVQQLGEPGVAIMTLVIALYTFLGGWLGKDINSMPIWITKGLLTAVWLFIALMTLLGNVTNLGKGKSHFQSPTPYWCWISAEYYIWRIWGEYFWFWITMFFSFVIYIPLYLWSRGNLVFNEHSWWKFSLHHAELNADPELRVIRRRSLVMLAYPVVYYICVLPLSTVRWLSFVQGRASSSAAVFTAAAIYGLGGALNVALLLTTRPDSFLFGNPKRFTSGRAPSRRRSLRISPEHRRLYTLRENEEGEDSGRLPS